MINLRLAAQPLNWITVAVWLWAIALLASKIMGATIALPTGRSPGSSSTLG